ncbi:putative triacylglycerol lipase [Tupanvirus deep ocean]|uniref:Triacylglycerol lipase n=2 Tax=Tupanvirus TaxID=2094720 RepID=A0AC62A7G6_9VIRU|nr:putative triacylglycerol lipase [Tupanvirus deep ocean]QKU33731.1 putative triacylglycerol lipase [Tupanvirus deep ocean]
MSSYEEKYHKYKKMYLDLKYGQHGGLNKINQTQDYLDDEYTDLISRLKNYCSQKILDLNIEQVRNKIENLYNNLGRKRLTELNIQNIFENEDLLRRIDWNKYQKVLYSELCNRIIPQLEKQKELQQQFVQKFRNTKINITKADIDKYIEFAKNNNMLDRNIDDIIQSYSQKAEQLANFWKKESIDTKLLMSNAIPVTNTIPVTTGTSGAKSKSGKECLTACEVHNDTLHGQHCRCTTAPYTFLFRKYDWDFCDEATCNLSKNTTSNVSDKTIVTSK